MSQSEFLKSKLLNEVNALCDVLKTENRVRFSCCNHSSWDQDMYINRYVIRDEMLKRGYECQTEINHGVVDMFFYHKVTLS